MNYAGMSVAGLFLLSACSAADVSDATTNQELAEQVVDDVTIANARMVLPPVSGNPAAIYFDLTYAGDATVAFESAAVEGAGTTMIHIISKDETGAHMMDHGPFNVAPGETVEFKPGELHIMVVDLAPEIVAGGTVPVTLAFSDGVSRSFQAEVRVAGDER
jgi:periplasmic copper chaperone A